MSKQFDITDLRGILQAALAELQDKEKPGDIARARAISELSGRVIDTLRVEVDYLRATNAKQGSGFIPHVPGPRQVEDENPVRLPTGNGVKEIKQISVGTVTTHRMR